MVNVPDAARGAAMRVILGRKCWKLQGLEMIANSEPNRVAISLASCSPMNSAAMIAWNFAHRSRCPRNSVNCHCNLSSAASWCASAACSRAFLRPATGALRAVAGLCRGRGASAHFAGGRARGALRGSIGLASFEHGFVECISHDRQSGLPLGTAPVGQLLLAAGLWRL